MTWLKTQRILYLFLFAEFLLTSQTLISGTADPSSALLKGTVTNAVNGSLIIGAKITVNGSSTYSVSGGLYHLEISPAGIYIISCTKPGFNPFTSAPISFEDGSMTNLMIRLLETPNPSPLISAALDTIQEGIVLNWERPVGNYELLYDDGIQDDFRVWAQSGNMSALKLTPLDYPANILGGSVNIGQASDYPPGSNPFQPFQIIIMDASGSGGSPGSILAGPLDVTPSGFGWVVFTLPSAVTITAGDFFIVMVQGGNAPDAAGLAVDMTNPGFRSYSRFMSGSGDWLPASGNFMIRALVSGPGGPPAFKKSPENVIAYEVWRLHQGEELNPLAWTYIDSVSSTHTVDLSWSSLPCGPFRWAVMARYYGNRLSTPAISNVVGKCWTAPVTVDLVLSCSGSSPSGTDLQLKNMVYPDTLYTASFDSTGNLIFPHVWKGSYAVTAKKFGYQDYHATVYIMGETTVNIILLQRKSPPTNLVVDSLSLYSRWDVPFYNQTLLQEDWSGGSFAGAGWTVAGGSNWMISTSNGHPAPSAFFNWSPRVYNYEQSIISPPLTGQNSPILTLKYDLSLENFSSSASEKLFVEISDGASWQTLRTWSNAGGNILWTRDELDISSFADKTFRIRFRSSGSDSYQINGWYIDNILVYASESAHLLAPCIYGYSFYLDNTLLATVTANNFSIPGTAVKYDSTYNACVEAIYTSGHSSRECRQITSRFLWPPGNLSGSASGSTALIRWGKPVYRIDTAYTTPPGISGYNVYRDDVLRKFIPGADILAYSDTSLDPGSYNYRVCTVYDLTPYGHPSQQGNSVSAGPVNVQIHYGQALPFSEPWNQGNFTTNSWTFPGGQGNFSISQNTGNPAPSAMFTGLPPQSGYSQILESPALDATLFSCASIWFDFDLKLTDNNATGTEKLIFEVNYNQAWHQKAEFVNSGSTNWVHHHIDISAVKEKGFKFRFLATGSNSANILNWFIDNISVYPVCLPAINLAGEAFGMDTHLQWSPPRCNGGGNQLNEGFEAQDFPPSGWDRIITNTSSTWTHAGISSPVGVHSGNYSAGLYWDYYRQDEWIIARNVYVNGNLKFWSLAYQGSSHGDHYYVQVSTDQGQSWVSLLDMSALPPYAGVGGYNHWQEPYVVDMSSFLGDVVDIAWHAIDGNGQGLWYYWAIDDCTVGGKKLSLTEPYYDVYRNDGIGNSFSKVNSQPVTDTTYTDADLPEGLYKYYVQIENPVCTQSMPSDTVLIDVVTSVSQINRDALIKVYPNPSHDLIWIKSELPIKYIQLFSNLGELVCGVSGQDLKENRLSLNGIAPGLYILRILTNNTCRNVSLIIR